MFKWLSANSYINIYWYVIFLHLNLYFLYMNYLCYLFLLLPISLNKHNSKVDDRERKLYGILKGSIDGEAKVSIHCYMDIIWLYRYRKEIIFCWLQAWAWWLSLLFIWYLSHILSQPRISLEIKMFNQRLS